MDTQTPRFERVLNMLVIRLTPSEKAAADRLYEERRQAMEADGRINALNFEVMYKSVFAQTHYGANGVEEVPEGTPMEPLENIKIPDDHPCWK